MGLACYLAMTASEFQHADTLPEAVAWMACHFSGYGLGLSNQPDSLPPGSVLILNDRIPICGHDPALIRQQLQELARRFSLKGILLDFERSGEPELAELAAYLTREACCPVCVSWLYAKGLDCPVFLPPPPLHMPLEKHLAPWKDRPVWLEMAVQGQIARITSQGCQIEDAPVTELPEPNFYDRQCCCRYHWQVAEKEAIFTMVRQEQELAALAEDARKLGVEETVGLYQQLGEFS